MYKTQHNLTSLVDVEQNPRLILHRHIPQRDVTISQPHLLDAPFPVTSHEADWYDPVGSIGVIGVLVPVLRHGYFTHVVSPYTD